MTEELANRLKGLQRPSNPGALSAVFGSAASMSQTLEASGPRLKIGLWPVQSSAMPEVALGMGMLLAALLERWRDMRVYRLLARVEGEPNAYQWTMEQSQFSVDDWELENLDENVAVWGTLNRDGNQWQLTLEIENDLAEAGDDTRSFQYSAGSLSELVARLPEASAQIAEYLDAGDPVLPAYSAGSWDENRLKALLEQLFRWELNLYLSLWGKAWPDEAVTSARQQLIEAGEAVGGEFGAWVVARAMGRALLPMFSPIGEVLIPLVPQIVETFDAPFTAAFLAAPLHQLDYRTEAYDLLENNIAGYPDDALSWLMLAQLYLRGGELPAAIDTYQRAIEADVTAEDLYTGYAELLLLLDAQNIPYGVGARQHTVAGRSFVEGFILIDPEATESDWLRWEAAEAYRAALETSPDDVEVLYQLLILLIDLDADQLWDDLARLIELDRDGERVRHVVDALNGLEEVSPAIEVLQQAIAAQPDRVDLRLSLAALYLMDDQPDAARTQLDAAARRSDSLLVKSEVDRLMLSVDDPEFEARFGEISDLVSAGSALNAADVEYLEDALDQAPDFAALYTLLASAYLKWGENDDALEVLLDGQRRFPDEPDILTLLGRVLWEAGEKELALDYLNKGLKSNPNHVPLLTTTGRYLFDNGQDEDARLFLTRAEALDPRHPALTEVRAYIARALNSE
ncbi:MAG: tetratricopeptide repeat protein [Chloroflexi bacterium]|nr:tetratricopeptide repeat protein [Chloroflexota bacterium]